MGYDPRKHHRRSIRLKGYDYSREGLYFVTICVRHHICLFGGVENGIMLLNDAGRMVEKWYYELGNKYPDKNCDEMVVMPNHFHCIIENVPVPDGDAADGNTLDGELMDGEILDAHVGTSLRGRSQPEPDSRYGMNNQKYRATIGDAMDWFKTMSTNEYIRGVKKYNWQRFDKKLWQINYWEHIIRDEQDYLRIKNYIIDNPKKWGDDRFRRK